jgi:hypothetical protein
MNKKRRILTVVALVIFGAIIFFHYWGGEYETRYIREGVTYEDSGAIKDVRMPLLVLAVFYAGLFLRLGDKKRDNSG